MNKIICRQSNALINSYYTRELTLIEAKFLEYVFMMANSIKPASKYDRKNITLNFSSKELYDSIQENFNNDKVVDLNSILDVRHISNADKSPQRQFLLSGLLFHNDDFKVDISWQLLPIVQQVNNNYTDLDFNILMSLSSSAEIKLYKLLKQYQVIGKRIFTPTDLAGHLFSYKHVSLDSESGYSHMDLRDTIDIAVNSINSKTDLFITIKDRPETIEFYINVNC